MFTSAELKGFSGATDRQLYWWASQGFIGRGYLDRATGRMVESAGSGYNRVFDALDLAMARVFVEVNGVLGQHAGRYAGVASALRAHPLEDWPGSRLVVSAGSASVDGPLGTAALVVDLGACSAGLGKARDGLALVG